MGQVDALLRAPAHLRHGWTFCVGQQGGCFLQMPFAKMSNPIISAYKFPISQSPGTKQQRNCQVEPRGKKNTRQVGCHCGHPVIIT